MSGSSSGGGGSGGFESFPVFYSEDQEQATALTKLKRFFGGATTTSTPAAAQASASTLPRPLPPSLLSSDLPGSRPYSAASSIAESSSQDRDRTSSRKHPLIDPLSSHSDLPQPDHAILPNGKKMVRPLRLSGVAPSVRLTVANSEKGDLVQSGSSMSISSDYRYGGASEVHGSPTSSEPFGVTRANLSSIPGFPLSRDVADDARSMRSVSTVARPAASVARIFRRLRGEGLSKDYWISDESATECYECQTVFTAFRRKHHCRICGQIFCSRCASNIISSARFGSQGFVRVCNLCLSIMEDGDPAQDESPATRFRSGLRESSTLNISAPLEASARPPQSQYAASHLFPRSETPYRAISEHISEGSSRAQTPLDDFEEEDQESPKRTTLGSPLTFPMARGTTGEDQPATTTTAVAPFRRVLEEDEDKGPEPSVESVEGLGILDVKVVDTEPDAEEEEDAIEIAPAGDDETMPILATDTLPPPPALVPIAVSAPSSLPIIIPPELDPNAPTRPSSLKAPSRPPPEPLVEPQTSQLTATRARSATMSRPGTSHLSSPPTTDGSASDFIFRDLPHEGPGPDPRDLSRLLSDPGSTISEPALAVRPGRPGLQPRTIEHVRKMLRQSLEKANVPHVAAWEKELLAMITKVATNMTPDIWSGDKIDIREYVHVKRIPGGHPRDSEYVEGVVFTKNVLHKQMTRHLANPRIMLFSIPLEYQRVEDQFMSLEPLLKQEREYLRLLVARIVAQRPHVVLVERNVSRLALEYLMEANVVVARNVKASVMASVARATQADIISSMDKLALEPRLGRCESFRVQTFVHSLIPGRRKSFIRIEGCAPDLTCTLLLRGGSMEVLERIKAVVDMMMIVLYSAKLEGELLRDELVVDRSDESPLLLSHSHVKDASVEAPEVFLNNPAAQERDRISKEIAQSLRPYESALFSGSPWVKFPPPYPLARMSEEDRRVVALRRLREYEETEQIISEEAASKQKGTLTSSSSSLSIQSLKSEHGQNEKTPAESALEILQTPQELARLTEFAEAETRHAAQYVKWQAYLAQVKEDKSRLDPSTHQQLYVLESLACTQTDRLCSPPTLRAITFYDENDVSLGQYVKNTIRDAGKACTAPNCGRHMLVHYRTWVHGHLRITMTPEAHAVPVEHPDLESEIVMFGFCEICKVRSRQVAMSADTYRLSFGKYLQLCFYAQGLVRSDNFCQHNAHQDHVRYLMYRGITFRVYLEQIDLRNVIAPPLKLQIKPEKKLQVRNEEYVTVLTKSSAFWDSISRRISQFNYDLVAADRLEESKAAMDEFSRRCDADRKEILRLLAKTYEEAQETNGTEMTSVRRALQNKAVEWEADFVAFEQRIIPSEKDVRRLTTVQLKRLFSDGGLPLSPDRRASSTMSLPPSVELDEKLEEKALDEKSEESINSALSSPGLKLELDGLSTDGSSTLSTFSLGAHSTSAPTSSVSSITNSPIASPEISTSSTPIAFPSTSGHDSDSTVCAHSSHPGSQLDSPFLTKRRPPHDDTTSGAESDADATPMRRSQVSPGVANLVNFFDVTGEPMDAATPRLSAATRPQLRRGATERPRSVRTRSTVDVFSDGDGSYARNVGVSHLSSRFADKPTRIPAPKTLNGSNSVDKVFSPSSSPTDQRQVHRSRLTNSPQTSLSISKSPTSSRPSSRPSSRAGQRPAGSSSSTSALGGHSRDSTLTKVRPGLRSNNSHKGKSKDVSSAHESEASDKPAYKLKVPKDLGVARPTTSSTNKTSNSRRVVSIGSISGHRVSAIANHFNKITREAEQRKMALFRGKRPRPVAVAHPTVQVFDNVKDAAKEDSDEDDSRSSDGADDEYDDDVEVAEDDEGPARQDQVSGHPTAGSSSTAATKDSFVYDQELIPNNIIEGLPHHPSDMDRADTIKADQTLAPPPALVDYPPASSVPPSPRLDGFSVPRVSEGESSGNERGSIIKAISNLWTYRGGEFTPLEYPLQPSEHIFADNPILLREDEPSSILAFTLSSKAYREKLKEQETPEGRVVERSEAFMPDETHPADRSSTWGVLDLQVDSTDVGETLRKPEAKHFRLQFAEGSTTFFCKIFFAEQFDALRRNCGCSNQFIESLARCVKWDSSGGRSKVDFLKTKDDRFIVKEISRLEMDALLRFAPAYFDYMSKAFFQGLPTLLAKIFGFYRIGLRNPTTGKVMRLDVLVTENLFYDRQLTQIFDLKGSTRNRHVQVSKDNPDKVLMDENLVQMSFKNPLYVREGSKRFITAAVFNDSLFLSNLNVMDYSLVVGVDSVKQELVVGIVDFIRTYTWDKKLESWVKDSAFLGGGSSKPGGPTIVTPRQYRRRFREAMSTYFLLAPDHWLNFNACKLSPGKAKEDDKDGEDESFVKAPDDGKVMKGEK